MSQESDFDIQCTCFENRLNDLLDRRADVSAAMDDDHLLVCSACQCLLRSYRVLDRSHATNAVEYRAEKDWVNDQLPRRFFFDRLLKPICSNWSAVHYMVAAAASVLFAMLWVSRFDSLAVADLGVADLGVDTPSSVVRVSQQAPAPAATNWISVSSPSLEKIIELAKNIPISDFEQNIRALSGPAGVIGGGQFLAGIDQAGEMTSALSSWSSCWRYTAHLPGIKPLHHSVNVAIELLGGPDWVSARSPGPTGLKIDTSSKNSRMSGAAKC